MYRFTVAAITAIVVRNVPCWTLWHLQQRRFDKRSVLKPFAAVIVTQLISAILSAKEGTAGQWEERWLAAWQTCAHWGIRLRRGFLINIYDLISFNSINCKFIRVTVWINSNLGNHQVLFIEITKRSNVDIRIVNCIISKQDIRNFVSS